jgi:tetratricopeptide (TPR) repeat protein
MDTYYQAAALNNSGAYHLLNKNYTEAISLFRSSVSKTKELVHRQSGQTQSSQRVLPPKKEGLRMEFIDLDCSSQLIESSDTSVHMEDSFVCKSAIIISQDDGDSKEASVHLLHMIGISAIYNLAIAHHLYGLRNRSPRYLQKALQYYAISYKIHVDGPLCSNPTHVLCVLNNMAMIHRSMGEGQRSSIFLRRLYSTMSNLDETGQKQDQRHWTGFWRNILGLVMDYLSTAAAA